MPLLGGRMDLCIGARGSFWIAAPQPQSRYLRDPVTHEFSSDFSLAAHLPFCPILVSALCQTGGKPVEDRHSTSLDPNRTHLAPRLHQKIEKQPVTARHSCGTLRPLTTMAGQYRNRRTRARRH